MSTVFILLIYLLFYNISYCIYLILMNISSFNFCKRADIKRIRIYIKLNFNPICPIFYCMLKYFYLILKILNCLSVFCKYFFNFIFLFLLKYQLAPLCIFPSSLESRNILFSYNHIQTLKWCYLLLQQRLVGSLFPLQFPYIR